MTNPLDLSLTSLINTAIVALAERTDPLITRVNEGGVLTNAESHQVFHDMFKLTTIMKASATAIEAAQGELAAQDKEIAMMKVLLGLTDSQKAGN